MRIRSGRKWRNARTVPDQGRIFRNCMAVSRHAARLITAMIALCGALALQRAEACIPCDFAIRLTECAADGAPGPGSSGHQSAAASTADSSDAAEAGSLAGVDSDPSDDLAAPVAWDHEHVRTAGLPLLGRRSAPIASARRASRSARGPPATR